MPKKRKLFVAIATTVATVAAGFAAVTLGPAANAAVTSDTISFKISNKSGRGLSDARPVQLSPALFRRRMR
jgi:hypothetical protein